MLTDHIVTLITFFYHHHFAVEFLFRRCILFRRCTFVEYRHLPCKNWLHLLLCACWSVCVMRISTYYYATGIH